MDELKIEGDKQVVSDEETVADRKSPVAKKPIVIQIRKLERLETTVTRSDDPYNPCQMA